MDDIHNRMNVVRRMLVSLRKGTMTEDEAMGVFKRFNSETLKYFGLNVLKDGLVNVFLMKCVK